MPHRTVDARLAGRHPFEVFVLCFALIVGIPTLIGFTPRPGSIQEAMPEAAAILWSAVLVVGAGVALLGVYWRNRAKGLILEQLGLGLTGLGCVIYGAAASQVVGATWPAGIIFGFGVACLWRYGQIQNLLNQAERAARQLGKIGREL